VGKEAEHERMDLNKPEYRKVSEESRCCSFLYLFSEFGRALFLLFQNSTSIVASEKKYNGRKKKCCVLPSFLIPFGGCFLREIVSFREPVFSRTADTHFCVLLFMGWHYKSRDNHLLKALHHNVDDVSIVSAGKFDCITREQLFTLSRLAEVQNRCFVNY